MKYINICNVGLLLIPLSFAFYFFLFVLFYSFHIYSVQAYLTIHNFVEKFYAFYFLQLAHALFTIYGILRLKNKFQTKITSTILIYHSMAFICLLHYYY